MKEILLLLNESVTTKFYSEKIACLEYKLDRALIEFKSPNEKVSDTSNKWKWRMVALVLDRLFMVS